MLKPTSKVCDLSKYPWHLYAVKDQPGQLRRPYLSPSPTSLVVVAVRVVVSLNVGGQVEEVDVLLCQGSAAEDEDSQLEGLDTDAAATLDVEHIEEVVEGQVNLQTIAADCLCSFTKLFFPIFAKLKVFRDYLISKSQVRMTGM